MASIIEVESVTKIYGGSVTAVDDVSLNVEEGEFVTLLGPSGCGKTTMLRLVAGFEAPDRGRLIIGGDDVTDVPPYRRPVNMVFQDYALFPHMNVWDNIAYGLKMAGANKSDIPPAVERALQTVEMQGQSTRKPHELSGGQRQRIALARALVKEPRVLLLDEPLAALDANLRANMRVELKHLHDRLGLTFLMVTHDQTEALVMADRVVLMENGKIAQQGSPTDIYEHPQSTYVANFIGSSNLFRGSVIEKSDTAITVSTGNAKLKAASMRALESGLQGDVMICVRPEKARLLKSGDDTSGMNAIAGTVEELLFHGNSVRVKVNLESGEPFMVDVQLSGSAADTGLPEKGTGVQVAFAPENTAMFPPEARR